jgi:hypothetical protein
MEVLVFRHPQSLAVLYEMTPFAWADPGVGIDPELYPPYYAD